MDGAIVELGPTTVRSTGKLKNIGGTFNFREGLIVDGGMYEEQAGSAAQRQLGVGQSIQASNGALLKFGETPLSLGSSQNLVLENSRVETLGGVSFSGGEVQAIAGVSALVGDFGAHATLRIAAGAELHLQGEISGRRDHWPWNGRVRKSSELRCGANPRGSDSRFEVRARFDAQASIGRR